MSKRANSSQTDHLSSKLSKKAKSTAASTSLASTADADTSDIHVFDRLVRLCQNSPNDAASEVDYSSSSEAEEDEDDAITRGLLEPCNVDQLFRQIAAKVNATKHSVSLNAVASKTLTSPAINETVDHDHNYGNVFEFVEELGDDFNEEVSSTTSDVVKIARMPRTVYDKVHKTDIKLKFPKRSGIPIFANLTDGIFLQQIKDNFQVFMPESLDQDSYDEVLAWLTQKLENDFDEFVDDSSEAEKSLKTTTESSSKQGEQPTTNTRKLFKRTGLTQDAVKKLAKRKTIVDETELLSDEAILAERLTFNDLVAISSSFNQLLPWLVTHRLVANSLKCYCGKAMVLTSAADKRHGVQWRCRWCNAKATIFSGSIFFHTHLDAIQILMLGFCFSRMYCGDFTHNEARVQSHRTRSKYLKLFRDVCGECLINEPITLGGLDENGLSHIVELDESMFFKLKHHKGKSKPIQQWVFGMVERGSNRCVLVPVSDRAASTLLSIIQQYILPGTFIFSDGWKAYTRMKDIVVSNPANPSQQMYAYENRVVNHSVTFKADDGTHTNTIEGLWRHAKLQFRIKNGVQGRHLHANLVEFCWRRRNLKNDLFTALLKDIAKVYKTSDLSLKDLDE